MTKVRPSMMTCSRIGGPRTSRRRLGQRRSVGRRIRRSWHRGSQKAHALHQLGVRQRPVGGEETVGGRVGEAVENQLAIVGGVEAGVAGDVPRDEQVGVHLLQERRGRFRARVAAPDESCGRSRPDCSRPRWYSSRSSTAGSNSARRERGRQAVAEEDAVRRPQRQRGGGDQPQVGGVDLVGPVAVGRRARLG